MSVVATPWKERFWRFVTPGSPDECWEWTGHRAPKGYGLLARGGKNGGPMVASRASYELHVAPIPEGLDVCHACDNPPCVNPAHLYVGTRKQNMADCTERDRHNKPRGEQHWCARLTEDDVRSIRQRRRDGETCVSIAADFGVHHATISRIARRVWRREV